jgi:hypothetical protein
MENPAHATTMRQAPHFVNAMLLNEVQRQQREIADLEGRIKKLEVLIGRR